MTSTIPFVDLGPEWSEVSEAVEGAISRVLAHRRFVLGAEVSEFERTVAAMLGVEHAIGVSSGTDALLAALLALDLGPGDEVVTTPLSFFATVEAILRVGATPRFADVDPSTLGIDADTVAPLLNGRTRAVLPVHLFGRAVDPERISALCQERDLYLVEDAAQAFGARFGDRALGGFGAFGCYSFFPAKPLGALGDGGLVVTSDAERAAVVRALRVHGAPVRGDHRLLGGNLRLDALQAAVLGAKLPGFGERQRARRRLARAYDDAFTDVEAVRSLRPLSDDEVAAVYTIRVPAAQREGLLRALGRAGVGTAVYYPTLLSEQPVVRGRCISVDPTPEASRAAAEVLSLPLYYGMPRSALERVADEVRRFFGAS